MMARHRFGTMVTAAMAALALFGTPAQAAPQVLALVASGGPIELACEGETCAAELSSYCLQAERAAPPRGTAYRPTLASTITVAATTRDGRRLTLAAHEALRFHALRGHTAIRVTLAPGLRARLGLASVRLVVADNVTLAPQAVAGDDNPISAGELAMVEQSLRPAGARIMDRNTDGMAAARVASRMINLLPTHEPDRSTSQAAWRRLMAQARGDGLGPKATRLAQNAYDLCRYFADRASPGAAFRDCLQAQHDSLIHRLNSDYWTAVKTGS